MESIIFVLLCQAYFTQPKVFKVHLCCSMYLEFHLFPLLSNISLYVHTTFFIHLSINGHLLYFHLLAIVNNTAMNTCVQIHDPVPAFNSFGYTSRSRITGS